MSEAERIARALGGRRSGTGWSCSCCSHSHGGQDKNRSLSLADGKLLVRCHKDCAFDDVMAALLLCGLRDAGRRYIRSPGVPPQIADLVARLAGLGEQEAQR